MDKEPEHFKIVKWLGNSLQELRTWSKSITEEVGAEILAVQKGRDPSDWKPMASVGAGVKEIRVAQEGDQYRVIFVAKFPEAVYILHAFEKKTRKTTMHDLELAKKNYKELLNTRKGLAK